MLFKKKLSTFLKIIVVIINKLAKNYKKTYKNLCYFFMFSLAM
jgi:hypothetical protein